jgi:hypothetical protein
MKIKAILAALALLALGGAYAWSQSGGYVSPAQGGGGGVTSVSGTAPIVSSGGNTPIISCPTCGASGANTALSNLAAPAINIPLLGPDGAAATPTYGFTNSAGTGLFNDSTHANTLGFAYNGTEYALLGTNIFEYGSAVGVAWSSTALASGTTQDTGLSRSAAGVVSVDTTAIGNKLGSLAAAGATLSGLTASSAVVTDGSKNLASKSIVGTDAGLATAATLSTTALTPVCTTANGGVSTTGCSPLIAAGSRWCPYSIQCQGGSTSILSSTANNPVLYLFYLPVQAKVTTIGFYTTTGVAASTGDIGMYSISGTTGTLVWHTGSISTATSSTLGTPVAITPVTMQPGMYFYATCDSSATVTMPSVLTTVATLNSFLGGTGLPHTWGADATDVCTTGVLPNSITTTNITNNTNGALSVPLALISN